MQLERASSNSGEAGLAGWISTNDVTLFTMVLVVLIALLLNSNLLKKSKALDAKSAEANTLLKNLDSTSAELGETSQQRDSLDEQLAASKRSLDATSERLKITQEERAALKKQLDETIALVAALNVNLDGLKIEKSSLETAKSDLEKQTKDLTAQASMLTQEKTTLNDQLATLGAQLNEKLKALKDVETQRERLQKQADDLDTIVASLQAKLNAAGIELVAMQKLSEQEKAVAAAQLKALEEKAAAESAKAEDYVARLRRAAEIFKGLQTDKATLTTQLTDAEKRFQQQLLVETRINRELVGINGTLKRVAVLFDASGSMKEAGNGGGDRWQEAQKIARTWLQHLDVDECVLIVYSSDVRTFPTDGTLANVRGENGEAVRHALLEHLTGVEPKGWTNTLEAMRKAYTYEGIDSMILFSDGAPTNPNLGRFDQGVANEIYALCRKHDKIPVNTVGLGNYFDEDLGTFLRTVANITGGTFLGR
jgi:predicted nuclease with TOPRIM domain